MSKRKLVGIVGTHGLPANYSGWETLVKNLVDNKIGVDYLVATPKSRKPNQPEKYKKISIYIPLNASGWQSVFYDLFSIIYLIYKCDSILILGVSGCVFIPFIKIFTKKDIIINTDGIEYRREKWGFLSSAFLKLSEQVAVYSATRIVADNEGIRDYINQNYSRKVDSIIPYGGVTFIPDSPIHIKKYKCVDNAFDLAIARIVPENNIEKILNAYNETKFPLIFIGNWESSNYSKNLKSRKWNSNISIFDADYDTDRITSLRNCCRYYIHGHSAGGTNPSLVEALSIGCKIFAYDVVFNRYVLKNNAYFWDTKESLKRLILCNPKFDKLKILSHYNNNFDWIKIVKLYEKIL